MVEQVGEPVTDITDCFKISYTIDTSSSENIANALMRLKGADGTVFEAESAQRKIVVETVLEEYLELKDREEDNGVIQEFLKNYWGAETAGQ